MSTYNATLMTKGAEAPNRQGGCAPKVLSGIVRDVTKKGRGAGNKIEQDDGPCAEPRVLLFFDCNATKDLGARCGDRI